ncbi:MAG TPA: beta-ketoacyl-ACP synthase III [Panacibacter sp.]|nr:beta-ketoacyl-ACP synthase III [Panacibacter sp.]HNP44804.1 beta-ketoacyl-ACP synthase III [Panacibacter sp.]
MKPDVKLTAAITAMGGYVPDYKLTNTELETLVDTNDEWIKTRTGIEERRVLKDPSKATSDLAIAAINEIIRKKNLDPTEIECIICCTMTPDMQLTVTAAYIAMQIGAVNAWGYDFTAACCGFIYGLTTAATYIESGRYKKILVIGVDNMTRFVDYKDRGTCIIFGDGAGAALVEPNYEGLGVIDSYFRTDGTGRKLMHQKAGGSLKPASHSTVDAREHYAFMDGRGVFKSAVNNMADSVLKVMERNNLTKEDIAWVVPHQANMRIIEAVGEQIGISLDKMMINIQRYGNTIAGTLPICLWEWEPRLKKGDNIMLVAFGGGFTWGASWIKWAYDGSDFLNGKHI